MNLLQRIGYYLGGFSIGLIILAFIFNKKKTSCSYGPEARVLKNINSKKIMFSENTYTLLKNKGIDSTNINHLIKKGTINFSKSNTRQKPCGVYYIESSYNEKPIVLTVENCDSIATLTNLSYTNQ